MISLISYQQQCRLLLQYASQISQYDIAGHFQKLETNFQQILTFETTRSHHDDEASANSGRATDSGSVVRWDSTYGLHRMESIERIVQAIDRLLISLIEYEQLAVTLELFTGEYGCAMIQRKRQQLQMIQQKLKDLIAMHTWEIVSSSRIEELESFSKQPFRYFFAMFQANNSNNANNMAENNQSVQSKTLLQLCSESQSLTLTNFILKQFVSPNIVHPFTTLSDMSDGRQWKQIGFNLFELTASGFPVEELGIGFMTQGLRNAVSLWLTNREEAIKRYGHISTWDTSGSTNMNRLFAQCSTFNEDISQWDVSNVTDMSEMFFNAISFNQSAILKLWNFSNLVHSKDMFIGSPLQCNERTHTLLHLREKWPTQFKGYTHTNTSIREEVELWCKPDKTTPNNNNNREVCRELYGHISIWDTSQVTCMKGLFQHCHTFNDFIDNWDVSHVTDMTSMFENAYAFNRSLSHWNVSQVVSMSSMFANAKGFNQSVSTWNVENVQDTSHMFYHANSFCQSLSSWKLASSSSSTTTSSKKRVVAMKHMFLFSGNNTEYLRLRDTTCDEDGWYQLKGQPSMTNELLRIAVTLWCSNPSQAMIDYGHISTWDTSSVTDMSELFQKQSSFNDNISNWNVQQVHTMKNMFQYANIYNQPLQRWGPYLTNVKDMSGMFSSCGFFNQSLTTWNTSQVMDMNGMFQLTFWFNQPLHEWNVSQVVNMERMFLSTHSFNQPLSSWDVSSVTNVKDMFHCAFGYNQQDLDVFSFADHWNLSKVTSSMNMLVRSPCMPRQFFRLRQRYPQQFESAVVLNNETIRELVSLWFSNRFITLKEYGHISTWNTSQVTDMSGLFKHQETFDDDIQYWDVSNVVTMKEMFSWAKKFNSPLNPWNVSQVKDMSQMFHLTMSFNQPLSQWDTRNVVTMVGMFDNATLFNQPIDSWNVSQVTNMSQMFSFAKHFNQPLDHWNVSRVKNMRSMFYFAESFNQSLTSWNVKQVEDMSTMFHFASNYKQRLDRWSLDNILHVNSMLCPIGTRNPTWPIDEWFCKVERRAKWNHIRNSIYTWLYSFFGWKGVVVVAVVAVCIMFWNVNLIE